mmetsp:Transcript_61733/g.139091  ORF Transcript_61733/g.139091 Transcript_61733/m.139091 type:complete len:253 (-) Transcript_61733:153-911(-)
MSAQQERKQLCHAGEGETEDVASDPSTELCSEDSGSECSGDDCDDRPLFVAEDTILIFDWDDTVLPSTWIQEQGLRLDDDSIPNEEQQARLEKMAASVAQTLSIAKRHGKVILVTNAEHGWIELSCQKFMPALYPSLENVKLLSARTEYETPAISSPFEWKLRAFESEIGRIFFSDIEGHRRKNVVSLGDSSHEREALIHATAHLPNCRTKSLKFVERPAVEQLRKQHTLVTRCFRRVVNHDGNLDLFIRPV